MTIRKTSDGAAIVDTRFPWLDVERHPPPSGKVQLIRRSLGVAVYGEFQLGHGWTHWAPLPVFEAKATQ